jgi:putative ABC transport system permease protein
MVRVVILSWIAGLFRTRPGRLAGSVAGVMLAVALIAALGAFLQRSTATMAARALATVPVDWQVELVPGASQADVITKLRKAAPVAKVQAVGYADVTGFAFAADGSTQATGAGKVVGIEGGYWSAFPGQIRILSGDLSGPVLLQQTAANLHAVPGDVVTIDRPGLGEAKLTISGVIDLKNADGFFQAIGLPPNAAPQAPPDNAAIVPMGQWTSLFDPQARLRPDSVRTQLHVGLDRAVLPGQPGAAYAVAAGQGHNFEARVAGAAVLSNSLAARLLATQGDALYVRVLFLFLGMPGVVLAALLTIAVLASGKERRRRDQSLLRLRGASTVMMLRFAALEGIAIGILGGVLGILLGELTSLTLLGSGFNTDDWLWPVGAFVFGLVLACTAILVPAWRSCRTLSVAGARLTIGRQARPLWQRLYLDLALLALAGLVFWQTAATGYQVVLAPEGVPATSVDYWAFLGPVLFWIGAGLLVHRLSRLLLGGGRRFVAAALQPALGAMAQPVAASLHRQRQRVAAGIALVALAFAFGVSTAVFNATYQGQAVVDAQLTNGADVTVTGTSSVPAGAYVDRLKAVPGVVAGAAMQHRYAYVGSDLQDLYGIDPTTIGKATAMADAYFGNGNAAKTLSVLADTPSAVLVSEETVKDFQLSQGDTINLRLQGADHQYHVVPFVFAGVAREFPTAPRDSFLVANASYVARMTGVPAREVVLLRTDGRIGVVQNAAERIVAKAPGLRVSNLKQASQLIGSSLTAVDLAGMTKLEVAYAVLLVAGATGLVLALGLADRRRSFAILVALGAKKHQTGAFIWSESLLMLVFGSVCGTVIGLAVAQLLVEELQGVFDPPPEHLAAPWTYLAGIALAATVATICAIANGIRQAQIDPVVRMRQLQ